MKKRKWFVIITLGLIAVILIGTGVKIHMDKIEELQTHKKIEKQIAKELISEYRGINKIKFTKISSIGDTGVEDYEISVNNGPIFTFNVYEKVSDSRSGIASDLEYMNKTVLNENNKRNVAVPLKNIELDNYQINYF